MSDFTKFLVESQGKSASIMTTVRGVPNFLLLILNSDCGAAHFV